jgi:hypothetical protein
MASIVTASAALPLPSGAIEIRGISLKLAWRLGGV